MRMAAMVSLLNNMEAQDNIPVRRLVQPIQANHRTEAPLGPKLMTIRAVMDMGSRLVGTARSHLKEMHMVVQVLRQCPDGGHRTRICKFASIVSAMRSTGASDLTDPVFVTVRL